MDDALLLLAADPQGARLPLEEAKRLATLAVELGRSAARQFREKGPADPEALADQLGVAVRRERSRGARWAWLSVYDGTITLYPERIAALALEAGLQPQALEAACIAHEIFHHLEKTELGPTSRRWPVTYLRLGPWRWQRGVGALREIAAHSFAQEYLQLAWWPGNLGRNDGRGGMIGARVTGNL